MAHAHHHDHDHDHGGHGHHHAHAPADFGAAFAIGTTINFGFVLVELAYGLLSHSMALVADAGHNFGDVLGLLAAWGAASLARRAPTARFTYGLRRGTILAALVNAALLLVAVGAIAAEAANRLIAPEKVANGTVMIVAAIGIVVNGATALLFARGRADDINIRGAFLHMAYDAAISAGVVVAAAIAAAAGWLRLDPLVSLAIAGVILAGTWSLLRDSVGLALDVVPPGVDAAAVRTFLESQPGVARLHDLHIWPMSTTETALTVHLVVPGAHPGDAFLAKMAEALRHRFRIGHATVQIEQGEGAVCVLEADEVV
ncbi:MAG TPA: cation diffusion facilitator family transporter [Acetobacteraceae bacterium]|nr:cation diffusion facilitator family transporter [Acetobacteraceae bacterium]